MRGGIFDLNYQIEKKDFLEFLEQSNPLVYQSHLSPLNALPVSFSLEELSEMAEKSEDVNFRRLCKTYMPLKFSRRHGDPSRPWNRFSIQTRNARGEKLLNYEGNWRDIFQNWEALAYSYPAFIDNMICKFINASTFDGYNPYRVTKHGFDWEVIEPDNPWSYIGYWGDHQIIYLLKFLEFTEACYPGKLSTYLSREDFVYANIPYRIKPYPEILENPKDTIEFDHELDARIRKQIMLEGSDAALIHLADGSVYTVTFVEKILAMLMAKISNFVPGGGIWMNTQRPEWNDANNALVGNGLSMVTLFYMRRFLAFIKTIIAADTTDRYRVSTELVVPYKTIREVLDEAQGLLSGRWSDSDRKEILDKIGRAAGHYRKHIYNQGFWGEKRTISREGLLDFIEICQNHLEHTIGLNKRPDNLYHAYNILSIDQGKALSVSHLSEMLEGQVAVISSGLLKGQEVVVLLDALKSSSLYRQDQNSYLLYPDKVLPGFNEKNLVDQQAVMASPLLSQMVLDGNSSIIEKDINGNFHFNGEIKNANDLGRFLDVLPEAYSQLVEADRHIVLQVYEKVFNHKAFTGRSGTFYGYEGLGSIYWHMVSKLRLAVQEYCLRSIETNQDLEIQQRLIAHYYEITEGIGLHKPPSVYGAFPTDPYSHTPAGKGAQQPGMTGQVKEDILCRFGELGVSIKDGQIHFNPRLLRKKEFLADQEEFVYFNVDGKCINLPLQTNSLCFLYCQIPVVYLPTDNRNIQILYSDGSVVNRKGFVLDKDISQLIFNRTGAIDSIIVEIDQSVLK